MSLSQFFKRKEELEAVKIKAAEMREAAEFERVCYGETFKAVKSIETVGFEAARRWIAERPGELTMLLKTARQWADAHFYYTDAEKAAMSQQLFRRRKHFYRGAKKAIERHFDEQGVYVPSQEDLDAKAIARILEFEGRAA